MLIVKTM